MLAFMSYQNVDKEVAARVAALLETLSVESFMAHEHIEVSLEWRGVLLDKLEIADIFVAILSKTYLASSWCVQESGIATYRKLAIIPLSIDGSTPPGFLSNFQSIRIDPSSPALKSIIPGLAKHDIAFTLDRLIERFGKSGNYRTSEANFALLQPYLNRASDQQITRLLALSAQNDQIYDAGGSHTALPPLIKSHGHLMQPADLEKLKTELKKYDVVV
jgi:TIR domain